MPVPAPAEQHTHQQQSSSPWQVWKQDVISSDGCQNQVPELPTTGTARWQVNQDEKESQDIARALGLCSCHIITVTLTTVLKK